MIEALKKRRVFRTLAAYAVVAWGTVQVVLTVAPEIGLPEWTGRLAVWLALAGIPLVISISWAIDLGERGVRRWRIGVIVVAMAVFTALATANVALRNRGLSEAEVTRILAQVADSANIGSYLVAYEILEQSGVDLDGDERAAGLVERVTEVADFHSDPEGARVVIAVRRSGDADPTDDLRELGMTPLEAVRLPRALHYVRFEMDGYQSAERPLDAFDWMIGKDFATRRLEVSAVLRLAESRHEEMVAVPGGEYTLASDVPAGISATLDDFLIDRYEVTNVEYAEFVRAGGYDDPRYWIHPFVDGVDTLTFGDAMSRLVDRTGLRAPRDWSGQEYPEGTGPLPITGVSWYEAAAYAQYRGKELPTAFQWEKAARDGRHAFGDVLMPWGSSWAGMDAALANFNGSGLRPVDSMPFGISPYGVHGMAGNALEWLRNPTGPGRAVVGGSWGGPPYTFNEFSGFEPFFASPYLGFRLVFLESTRQRLSADQGAQPIDFTIESPSYEPVDLEASRAMLAYFDYDAVELASEVSARVDMGPWIREDISFNGPYGERIPAHLYLPKAVLPPYQTIMWIPSGAALMGSSVPEDTERVMAPIIRSGRAVLAVALKGMTGNEHPPDYESPESSSVRFRDELVRNAVEMRVGLDYLATRTDVDMTRLGYAAFSFGAGSRGALLASDPRFTLAVLHGAGIDERVRPTRPEVDPVNFAPYYDLPILLLQGRHDEEHPYESRFLPLYDLLPEERTTLILVDGAGHLLPAEDRVPPTLRFLDEHWGSVTR